jgi:hypothetical protein
VGAHTGVLRGGRKWLTPGGNKVEGQGCWWPQIQLQSPWWPTKDEQTVQGTHRRADCDGAGPGDVAQRRHSAPAAGSQLAWGHLCLCQASCVSLVCMRSMAGQAMVRHAFPQPAAGEGNCRQGPSGGSGGG